MMTSNKARMDWFQNDTYITISIFIKNTTKDQIDYSIQSDSILLKVHLSESHEYNYDINLSNPIIPKDSTLTILKSQIEIKLKKAVQIQWTCLESTLQKETDILKTKKNWDQVLKSEQDEKPEGEAALNEIYADGDETTRKAMIKSFTESNGTCLSTNWSEIGAKKTLVSPPDGMTAKKFEN